MMSLSRYSDDPNPKDESGAAINVGEGQNRQQLPTRWGTIVVIFMRVLAAIWICQGLAEWAKILLPEATFDTTLPSNAAMAAVIFFAIADLLAAVGLWLATPWGGALWLFAAFSQIFVVITVPNFYSGLWAFLDMLLVIAYFVLTWMAANSTE